MVCVEELCKSPVSLRRLAKTHRGSAPGGVSSEFCISASVNKQVVDLSEELARKVEDTLRQQEEISSLLAQIVDLQARCKMVR